MDYPQADTNLSIRLSELTKVPVSFDQTREPNHLVVRLTDEALFQCPFVMMTEVGATFLGDDEVERLREYLLKGGFLWADDFWGTREWLAGSVRSARCSRRPNTRSSNCPSITRSSGCSSS